MKRKSWGSVTCGSFSRHMFDFEICRPTAYCRPSGRGGEGEGRLTVPEAGVGLRTEEMSPGKHCENVTATLTAGQFSKRDAAGHFPLCVGTKGRGGSGGSRD